MKLVKILIAIMFLVTYVYSTYKTIVEPEKNIWGWLCVIIFIITSIWAIVIFTKSQNPNSSENN